MVSLGPLEGTTPNYGFNLINFDWVAWSEYEHENWTVIDALLAAFIGINNVSGQWANNTAYTVGQRIVDSTDGTIWEVLIAHTSAAAGTFAADRTANPTFWQTISPYTPIYKGVWANNVLYTKSDFVSDPNRYFIAKATHTSPAAGTIDNDIANWDTLIDLTTWANDLAATNVIVGQNVAAISSNTGIINININQINNNATAIGVNASAITNLQAKKGLNIISTAVDYPILPVDLMDYDALIVLVDASVATRTITLPAPADYVDKEILIIADVDPAGNSVITNGNGGNENHTSYARGDFFRVISNGTNRRIIGECVTVRGFLAKTLPQSIPATSYAEVWTNNYAEEVDIGGWWDITLHQLKTTFSCEMRISTHRNELLPRLNGSTAAENMFDGQDQMAVGETYTRDYIAGDIIEGWTYNSTGVPVNFAGAATKNSGMLKWEVVKRLR